MLRKFYYLFLTVALLGGAACSSSDSDDSDPTPPEGETVLVGQISDATTGIRLLLRMPTVTTAS